MTRRHPIAALIILAVFFAMSLDELDALAHQRAENLHLVLNILFGPVALVACVRAAVARLHDWRRTGDPLWLAGAVLAGAVLSPYFGYLTWLLYLS